MELKRRPLADRPATIIDAWQNAFSVKLSKEKKDALVLQVQVLCKEVREEAAKLAEDGYRCKNCEAFFLGNDGHDCGNPDWQSLTANDIAAGIRNGVASAAKSTQKGQPDCICGHPYHVGGCAEIVAGYEFNESCTCDEYEARE